MRIFISYSTKDIEFARSFRNELETKLQAASTGTGQIPEMQIFLASDSIEPGEKWFDEVEKALSQSEVFVAIISSNYATSEWCTQEWQIAHSLYVKSKNSGVLPPLPAILLVVLDKNSLSYTQRLYQFIEASASKPQKAAGAVKDSVLTTLVSARKYQKAIKERQPWQFRRPKATAYLFPPNLDAPISFADVEFEINSKYDLDPQIPELSEAWISFTRRPGNESFYDGLTYRLVGTPKFKAGKLILPVARTRYAASLALRSTDPVFDAAKVEVQRTLETFPKSQDAADATFPVFSPGTSPMIPIGVEVLVITTDRKLLLRHRGPLHDMEVDRWGISFAGYILADRDEKWGAVNPLWTILREALYELNRTIEARMCQCLGLHYNRPGRTMDLLAVYRSPREDSSKIFEGLASPPQPADGVPFLTTKRLEEVQLEHSLNVFLPFDQLELRRFIVDKCNNSDTCGDLILEAYSNIMQALKYETASEGSVSTLGQTVDA